MFRVKGQDKPRILTASRELKNGWKMTWTYREDDPDKKIHVSAQRGKCRVHFSGEGLYAAYKVGPHRPMGSYETALLAMEAAQKPYEDKL